MQKDNNVKRELVKLGLQPQHQGFDYLVYAIVAAYDLSGKASKTEAKLSEMLSGEYDEAETKLFRCMDYAIEVAWDDDDNIVLRELFPGRSEAFSPTVLEFIYRVGLEVAYHQDDK